MAGLPLEDNFTDIIGKAQRGLGLSDAEFARRADVSIEQLRAAKSGKIDEGVIRKLASVLSLGPDALVVSAQQTWYPKNPGVFITQGGTPAPPIAEIEGLACFNTPFDGMTVNSFLMFDPSSRSAAAFDTGTDCDLMVAFARDRNLKIESIFLTHTHGDHVCELDRLKELTDAAAYVSEREPMAGATPFADGRVFEWGKSATAVISGMRALRIEARRTSGHARGGTTFVVTGLPKRLAIVGDALFAGSMGGGMVNYAEALRTNRENIFTLPDDTVICPGHGPLTTVGEEKQHNPFYPEFQK